MTRPWHELARGRDEFHTETFDAMVTLILDLRAEKQALEDRVAELEKEAAEREDGA